MPQSPRPAMHISTPFSTFSLQQRGLANQCFHVHFPLRKGNSMCLFTWHMQCMFQFNHIHPFPLSKTKEELLTFCSKKKKKKKIKDKRRIRNMFFHYDLIWSCINLIPWILLSIFITCTCLLFPGLL